MSERIYRDPVHNIIRLRTDTDEGELMMRLIDAPEFQRFRRIRPLGLGLYAYQGAEHSRFTHSLGAFHLMTRVLDRLGENTNIRKVIAQPLVPLHCFTMWATDLFPTSWKRFSGFITKPGPWKWSLAIRPRLASYYVGTLRVAGKGGRHY